MSENMNDDLQKFEEIEKLISDAKSEVEVAEVEVAEVEVAELEVAEVKAAEVEDAEAEVAEVKDAEVEVAEVEDAEVEVAEVEVAEVKDAEVEVAEVSNPADSVVEKTASIMMQLNADEEKMPSLFMTDTRFKEMEDDDDLITDETYDGLDDDAKESYEAVDVYEEGSGKGYGKRYRRRSPLEVNAMRKATDVDASELLVATEVEEKAEDDMSDMFDTEEEALERAAILGCEGTHSAGDKIMPCASHDDWQKLTAVKPDAAPAPAPAPAPAAAPAAAEKSDDFLCGFQRKSVAQPCDFCQGGCAPEDGLPGLIDIESVVKAAHPGEIIGSGYSSTDDMFVVDVKGADGTCIEVFLSGEGDELGWLRVDENLVEGKSAQTLNIISSSDAESVAVRAFDEMELDVKSEVMGIMVDIFADEDVYVVEIDSDQKSFDFYVSVEGKVLGYDEYDMLSDFEYAISEEDEIKALEAELEIKRMYSREQRESMAESGEAMEDGSFPIADEADLKNALAAFQRAKDVDAAKAHIAKRAKELGLEEMLPDDFTSSEGDAPEAEQPEAEVEGEKSGDSELLSALNEFRSLMEDGLS